MSEARLLHLFFRSIDATDAGGQFCDRGESYRTAAFVHSAEERARAEAAKAEAYRFYRKACGRDARVAELWGQEAPFVHHPK